MTNRILIFLIFIYIIQIFPSASGCQTLDSNNKAISNTDSNTSHDSSNKHHHKKKKEIVATGEHSQILINKKPDTSVSSWDRFKMKLPFWPRKVVTFIELGLIIIFGILIGQVLEELGIIRFLGFLTWPISSLGKLSRSTSPAFIFALQSGAVANSMLITQHDNGQLSKRELYTSVFVVSSVSLFAHLPTFIVPLGMAFGWKAAGIFFGVRFAAIAVQIFTILFVSNIFFYRKNEIPLISNQPINNNPEKTIEKSNKNVKSFFNKVWKKSKKSIQRLLIYLLPTFFATAFLEKSGFFEWLGSAIASVPLIHLLPSQAAAVVAAQAVNLYNGAIMAASFVDNGSITIREAVLILLCGTLISAPIRTLKHSLGSYVAILGARPGLIMAIATQLTRSIFLLLFIIGCAMIWR